MLKTDWEKIDFERGGVQFTNLQITFRTSLSNIHFFISNVNMPVLLKDENHNFLQNVLINEIT